MAPRNSPIELQSVEIKDGIVKFMKIGGVPAGVADLIRPGLDKTCMLNSQAYTSLTGSWSVNDGTWTVSLTLDDYGRPSGVFLSGLYDGEDCKASGEIRAMPPDTFRRQTMQPIPAPKTVAAPAEHDTVGIIKAKGLRGLKGPRKSV